MNYTTNKQKDKYEIVITFTKEEWEREVDEAYKKTSGKYNVQGFRKGKAPRGVIEKNYGQDVFSEEALRSAFPKHYNQILKDNPAIKPVDYPELDFAPQDGGMKITAKVDIEPEFTLGKYTGLEIKKAKISVTDEEVAKNLEDQARSRARQVAAPKGHKVVVGDIAVIDFVGCIDGVEFEGGKGKKHELEIGSHSFIDNFEDQLVGAKMGDELKVDVKFPEDYHVKELAGKPALFTVNITNILIRDVPAIDDEFAKEISEFDNLADYKTSIKETLSKRALEEEKKRDENELLKTVVEGTKIEVPDSMVEYQLDNFMRDLQMRLGYQGMNLEMYAQYTGMTVEALRETQRENAVISVKSRLIFDAIMDKENIQVTEEEVEEEIVKRAAESNKKPEDLKKTKGQVDFIREDLRLIKLIKFLMQNNKIA